MSLCFVRERNMPLLYNSSYSINFPNTHYQYIIKKKKSTSSNSALKGTKRVIKLFVLCALLPGFFLTLPLYLRFKVYIQQVYPVGVSDMRIIDSKISTTWCQKQLIHANTTFNAYVVANEPEISDKIEKISMRQYLTLKDGSKEYWGFYLLKGSSFTVSSCVRWPGASLIIIEGHRNLKECAYVGDNSSEENDFSVSSEENRNVTVINHMTKVASGMTLNNWKILENAPENTTNQTSTSDDKISQKNNLKRQNVHLKYAEELYLKENRKKLDLQAKLNQQNKNTTSKPTPSHSDELLSDIVNRLELLGNRGKQVVRHLRDSIDKELAKDTDAEGYKLNSTDDDAVKLSAVSHKRQADLLAQILDKIVKNSVDEGNRSSNGTEKKTIVDDRDQLEFKKIKKEILYHRMQQLNLDVDNETDAATEVFYEEDKADLHGSVKNTKTGDRSKSEFWSSFSSSEERLLECKGLLASLPLIPYHTCERQYDNNHLDEVSKLNAISYTVKSSGYYFFIFNNENEVKENFIHAHFAINKTVYNTADAVASCKNESKECSLPLTFWSQERTILQLPHPSEDSSWNEEYIFVSKCEPRSLLYLVCFMSIPLCLLLFAFT